MKRKSRESLRVGQDESTKTEHGFKQYKVL